ncbi:MAG: BTAD domain-containing putative transcriptional regulator [Caldilineaceae bacterium]
MSNAMTQHLRLQLFGGFQLLSGTTAITGVNTQRLQSLLAYLVLHRQAPQSRQQLAFLFWPDSNEQQARTNLRNALFQLRNQLPDPDLLLQVESQTLQWRADAPLGLDVADFEEALAIAQTAKEPAAVQQALQQAVNLYVGELLPGHYDEWLLPLREQLQNAYFSALEQLIALYERQQNFAKALETGQRLLQLDPLRETSYAQLMRLYAAAGDRAAALRIYHTCAKTLERELGVDPDPLTHELYEHILKLESPQTSTATRVRDSSPLIGRESVWQKLQECWQAAARGNPRLLLVSGEAGIGKTRLVEEFAEWARRQGALSAIAHCYALGGDLAFAPLQEWLRSTIFHRSLQGLEPVWLSEIARLLPELLLEHPELTPPVLPNEAWQRTRLFDAIGNVLTRNREPLLLVIDDIQWCDEETLAWIQPFLRFAPIPRVLIVATLRQESFTAQSMLTSLVNQLQRSDLVTEIEIERLDAQQTAALAANLLGRPLDASQSERLFVESEGNPLFVVELLRSAANNLSLSQSPTFTHSALPAKVLSVIESRLAHLSGDALELARLASVMGRAFSVDVLVQASDRNEDQLIRGLDELWQQRVIREQSGSSGGEAYDFSHDKIRDVVYAGISPMRRRFFHRRVAQTLERPPFNARDGVNAQVARHYEAAGDWLPAVDWLQRAAHSAHQRSALSEAIAHLERALTLLEKLPTSAERTAQELRVQSSLGSLRLATQGYAAPEVEQAFSRAWALCQNSDDQQLRFRILWGLGRYYFVLPNPEKGLDVSTQLLEIAQASGDSGLLAEATCSLGTHLFHRADFAAARSYLEQSIAHYDRASHADHALIYGQDPCVVSLAYLAWTLWCLGDSAKALQQSAAASQLAETLQHPYSLVIATTYASVQQQFLGNVPACLQKAEAAIQLAERHGFTLWLSMAKFLRGWSLSRLDQFEAGFAEMQESIALFRSTGAELGAAYFAGLLAETLALNHQPDLGLLALGEAFDLLERAQDRWCEAELYRIKAQVLRQYAATIEDDSLQEEAQAALTTAHQVAVAQGARQWETRIVEGMKG